MKTPFKNNIAYGDFQKKTSDPNKDIDHYESIKDSYKYIERLDGKFLNAQDKHVLDLLLQLTKSGSTVIDYPWLENKFGKSHKTMQRTLRSLSNLFICEFHHVLEFNNSVQYNKILVTRTLEINGILEKATANSKHNKSIKRNKNGQKNGQRYGQKCPDLRTKMSTTYIEDRITENKEEITIASRVNREEKTEPDNFDKFSILSEVKPLANVNEKIVTQSMTYKRPPETQEEERKYMNAHRFIKRESEGVAGISSILEKAFGNNPIIAESIKEITQEQQEIEPMNIIEPVAEESKETRLKEALKENLDPVIAEEIEKKCEFRFTPFDNKLTIAMQKGLELSDETKQAIKSTIHEIYGGETSVISGYKKYSYFAIIRNNISEKIGIHAYKNWFEKLELKEDYSNKKVILKGSEFLVSQIKSRFEYDLKDCLKNSGADVLEIISDSSNDSLVIFNQSSGSEIQTVGVVKEFHVLWDKFTKAINNHLSSEKGEYVIRIWFDQLIIGNESNKEKLVLVGEERIVDHIAHDYTKLLDHVVKATGMEVELRYFDNTKLPINYSSKK